MVEIVQSWSSAGNKVQTTLIVYFVFSFLYAILRLSILVQGHSLSLSLLTQRTALINSEAFPC